MKGIWESHQLARKFPPGRGSRARGAAQGAKAHREGNRRDTTTWFPRFLLSMKRVSVLNTVRWAQCLHLLWAIAWNRELSVMQLDKEWPMVKAMNIYLLLIRRRSYQIKQSMLSPTSILMFHRIEKWRNSISTNPQGIIIARQMNSLKHSLIKKELGNTASSFPRIWPSSESQTFPMVFHPRSMSTLIQRLKMTLRLAGRLSRSKMIVEMEFRFVRRSNEKYRYLSSTINNFINECPLKN